MQGARTSHPVERGVRLAAWMLLLALSCGWLFLYFHSLSQRRKAERLIADLKSFPFATADFQEVRDFVNRHDGAAVQQFPLLQLPRYSVPFEDSQGRLHVTNVQPAPVCTVRDCTFEIWIRTLQWLPFQGRKGEMLYTSLRYLGIRPWVVYARFEVSGGKLSRSRTAAGCLRNDRLGRYDGLIPFGYEVNTVASSRSADEPYDYTVGFPHFTGGPEDVLTTWAIQDREAPMRRAFDINLHCLTAVFHSCRGFDELAPSAWADYRTREERSGADERHE